MIVSVSQEDIRKGIRRSAIACPIANSLRRTGFKFKGVDSQSVFLQRGKVVPLPHNARHFIRNFDLALPAKPFSFDLPI